MTSTASSSLALFGSTRTIELHHVASTEETASGFVVLPPEKDSKKSPLESVIFSDGKAIRRKVTRVNQLCPYEVIQMVDPETDKPKYHCSDPKNSCKIPGDNSVVESHRKLCS